ncbi:type IV pilin N-terminal domain-containing protein [Candidatus Pacearchaeota archaeon]|nr:type IV pilin N-terminal domain-containing protein [Candidatus Pacearchaeota archaeon]
MQKKRGLSPVIASVLLVGITIILAAIVFFYSRQFIGEVIEKDDRNIELLCEDVSFISESYGGKIYIENKGSVPLYGIEVRKKGVFDIVTAAQEFEDPSVGPGETADIDLPVEIETNQEIIIVPMLLGEVKGRGTKLAYACDEDYGQEILVG